MDTNFIGGKEACEILGVHRNTLYTWERKGTIEVFRNTPRGKRYYNVKKYMEKADINITKPTEEAKNSVDKENIIYARVSSVGQKNDLERQVKTLKENYPEYTLITDIGSGVNLNKRGLRKIIDMAIQGKIEELVVVHKARLCRFGYELIEDLIIKYSNGKIIIMEEKENKEPKEELVEDVLQIMNIFAAKMNGLRKYNKA